MLVVVVIIFTLSWLPLYAIFIRIKLGSEQMDAWEGTLLAYATPVAQWLGASNSCINPVLYAYFNQKYRRGFTAIIQSGSCCGTIRTTLADYEQRYVTTSEMNINGSSRRGPSVRRPILAGNQATAAVPRPPPVDGNPFTANNFDRRRYEPRSCQPNGAVVNTQDSIELNAIHRKWKSQVI